MNTYIIFFKSILEISLFASIMVAVIFLIKAIFKNKIDIKTITFLWLLVIVRLCLPVTVQSPVHIDSLIPDAAVAEAHEAPDTLSYDETAFDAAIQPDYEAGHITPGYDAGDGDYTEKLKEASFFKNILNVFQSIDLWGMVSIIWFIGFILVLVFSVEKSITFALYAKRNSQEIDDKKLLISFDILKIKCNIRRNIKISTCKFINMPVMYGALCPHILLPASMVGKLKKEHMDTILLHELCHIKSRDILKNYAFLLGKALHWFNPLVWIAQKTVREDTELLCDQNVLNIIGEKHKGLYSQSLLEATRFVIERKTPKLTISLCENKSNLKERIIQMLKPQKKLKSAGIISVLAAILMIVGCFTTACQPTVDETIDYSPTNDAQPAADNSETQPLEETIENNEPEADFSQYETPETFAKTYEKGSLMIMVDAEVEVPSVEKLYSAKFEERELTQELVDMFLDYFMGDSPLYMREGEGEKASTLENEIASWKQAKQNAENKWDEVKNKDPYQGNGGQQGAIEYIEDVIQRLEKQLGNATEEYGYVKIARQLALPADDGGKDIPEDASVEVIAASKAEDARVALANASMRQLIGYAKVEESELGDKMAYVYINGGAGRHTTLSFDNANEATENGYMLNRAESDEVEKTMTMPIEDAITMAKNVMQDLGIGDTYLQSYDCIPIVKDGQLAPCYSMWFTNSLNGTPVLHLSNGQKMVNRGTSDGSISVAEDMTVGSTFGQSSDSVYVMVDESGVLKVSWDPILQQTENLNEYTDIMSFEDIVSVFDEMILEVYSQADNLDIVINKISLSMLPVTMEGSDDIITVPVWDFRGYSYDPNDVERKNKLDAWNSDNTSFLTINAIDGSLVDR